MSEFRKNVEGLIIGERLLETPLPPTTTPTPTPTSTPAPSQYDTGYTNLHTMILDDNPHGLWAFPSGVSESPDLSGNSGGVSLFSADASVFINSGYLSGCSAGPMDFDTGTYNSTLIPDGSSYSVEFMLHMDAAIQTQPEVLTAFNTAAWAISFGPLGPIWYDSEPDTRPRGLHFYWNSTSGEQWNALDFAMFNRWNHIAIVVDSSIPQVRVYVNGSLASLANNATLLPYVFVPLMDGSYVEHLGQNSTISSMDTLAIYHRQLTTQEISDRAYLVASLNPPKPAPLPIAGGSEGLPRPSPTPTPTPSFAHPTLESEPWVVDFTFVDTYDSYSIISDNNSTSRVRTPRESRILEAGVPGAFMCVATNASVLLDGHALGWSDFSYPLDDQYTAQIVVNLPSRQPTASVYRTNYVEVGVEKSGSGDWHMRVKVPNDASSASDLVVNVQNDIGNSRLFVITIVKTSPETDVNDFRLYINGGQVGLISRDNSSYGTAESFQDTTFIGGNFGIGQFTFFDNLALNSNEVYSQYLTTADVSSLVPLEDFPYLYAHAKGTVEIADVDNGLIADFRTLNSEEDLLLLTDRGSASASGAGSGYYGTANGFVRYTLFDKDSGFISPETKQNHYVDDLVSVDQTYLDSQLKIAIAKKVGLREPLTDADRTPVSPVLARFVERNNFPSGGYNINGIKAGSVLGHFVVWTQSGEVFRTVTNGFTWELTTQLGTPIYDVLVKPGTEEFIVLTTSALWKTVNFGYDYTFVSFPFGSGFYRGGNAASDTTYVVNYGSALWRSDDGVTWASTAASSNSAPSTMVWHEGAGLFVFFDHNYTEFSVFTSPTGEVWTNRNSTFIPTRENWLYTPSYYDGKITALLLGPEAYVVTSTDGINFDQDESVTPYYSNYATPNAVLQSTENPDQVFMICGTGAMLVFDRGDGTNTWKIEPNQFANGLPEFMTYGESGMVAIGNTNDLSNAFSIFSTISDEG